MDNEVITDCAADIFAGIDKAGYAIVPKIHYKVMVETGIFNSEIFKKF